MIPMKGTIGWAVLCVALLPMLTGCAGGGLSFSGSQPAQPETVIAGRWILAAPGAPSCGMNFTGAPGAREGRLAPEGGCPGRFFLSRHWRFEQGALVINDDDNNSLAKLNFSGTQFEGQSSTGMPVTLTRATPAG